MYTYVLYILQLFQQQDFLVSCTWNILSITKTFVCILRQETYSLLVFRDAFSNPSCSLMFIIIPLVLLLLLLQLYSSSKSSLSTFSSILLTSYLSISVQFRFHSLLSVLHSHTFEDFFVIRLHILTELTAVADLVANPKSHIYEHGFSTFPRRNCIFYNFYLQVVHYWNDCTLVNQSTESIQKVKPGSAKLRFNR
jgi:hypothetical protein